MAFIPGVRWMALSSFFVTRDINVVPCSWRNQVSHKVYYWNYTLYPLYHLSRPQPPKQNQHWVGKDYSFGALTSWIRWLRESGAVVLRDDHRQEFSPSGELFRVIKHHELLGLDFWQLPRGSSELGKVLEEILNLYYKPAVRQTPKWISSVRFQEVFFGFERRDR